MDKNREAELTKLIESIDEQWKKLKLNSIKTQPVDFVPQMMGSLPLTIEATALNPLLSFDQIHLFVESAFRNNTRGVCLYPQPLIAAHARVLDRHFLQRDPRFVLVTVLGFPHGNNCTQAKVEEAKWALEVGHADELDMVMNLFHFKNKQYAQVFYDIAAVKRTVGRIPLKVIVETDYLSPEEKVLAYIIVHAAGADFIKTSTGTVKEGKGATVEDMELFTLAGKVLERPLFIKASSGIKNLEKAQALLSAGAHTLGIGRDLEVILKELSQAKAQKNDERTE